MVFFFMFLRKRRRRGRKEEGWFGNEKLGRFDRVLSIRFFFGRGGGFL